MPPGEHFNETIKRVITMLPFTHRIILKYLCKFLKRVSKSSEINKMTPANIAIVFAPNLLKPIDDDITIQIADTPLSNRLMELFVKEYDAIFAEEPDEPPPKPKKMLMRRSISFGSLNTMANNNNDILVQYSQKPLPKPPAESEQITNNNNNNNNINNINNINNALREEFLMTSQEKQSQSAERLAQTTSPPLSSSSSDLQNNSENNSEKKSEFFMPVKKSSGNQQKNKLIGVHSPQRLNSPPATSPSTSPSASPSTSSSSSLSQTSPREESKKAENDPANLQKKKGNRGATTYSRSPVLTNPLATNNNNNKNPIAGNKPAGAGGGGGGGAPPSSQTLRPTHTNNPNARNIGNNNPRFNNTIGGGVSVRIRVQPPNPRNFDNPSAPPRNITSSSNDLPNPSFYPSFSTDISDNNNNNNIENGDKNNIDVDNNTENLIDNNINNDTENINNNSNNNNDDQISANNNNINNNNNTNNNMNNNNENNFKKPEVPLPYRNYRTIETNNNNNNNSNRKSISLDDNSVRYSYNSGKKAIAKVVTLEQKKLIQDNLLNNYQKFDLRHPNFAYKQAIGDQLV